MVPSLRRHVARQIMETEPAQRRFRGRVWWNASGAGGDEAGAGGKVQAPRTDCAGRGEADEGLGRGRGEEGGRRVAGGLGVALPCPSAKRSRLVPQVFDDRSYAGSLFVIGRSSSESCEKLANSILSTGLASPALHRLVLRSLARQLFGDCSRVVPSGVIR